MVVQRRPANVMAPDPVAIANAMAALQPRVDIAKRVQKVPKDMPPSYSGVTKQYPKEQAMKEFGITSEEYDAWLNDERTVEKRLRDYNGNESQDRAGAPDPEARKLIGPGAGILFDDKEAVIDPMAIDRDYRRLRNGGFDHQSALNQIYHAYGFNGYALKNLLNPEAQPRDFYQQKKHELRSYIRPYDPNLIG